MSADRLRQAAQKIRTPAQTMVQWRETGEGVHVRQFATVEDELNDAGFTEPDVALAVANLLDETAETWAMYRDPLNVADDAEHFIALADLILGSDE